MPKAETIALANALGLNLADPALFDRYYKETIFVYGSTTIMTDVAIVPSSHTVGQYTVPEEVDNILAVIYDDKILRQEAIFALNYTDPNWRDRLGTPICYVREQETDYNIRLYPRPEIAMRPPSFITGSPMGTDYPGYAIAIFHTEHREDVPLKAELPTALNTVALEFERESSHRDLQFATRARQLADLMLRMLYAA